MGGKNSTNLKGKEYTESTVNGRIVGEAFAVERNKLSHRSSQSEMMRVRREECYSRSAL
jgi:hypothetical protein